MSKREERTKTYKRYIGGLLSLVDNLGSECLNAEAKSLASLDHLETVLLMAEIVRLLVNKHSVIVVSYFEVRSTRRLSVLCVSALKIGISESSLMQGRKDRETAELGHTTSVIKATDV